MPGSLSPELATLLSISFVPLSFLAGWALRAWRASHESRAFEARLAEEAAYTHEEMEHLRQSLAGASAELSGFREGDAARRAASDERSSAYALQVEALERLRSDLVRELDEVRREHDTTRSALAARQSEVDASSALLDELQQEVRVLRANIETRGREFEQASARVQELERVAAERAQEIAALRAAEAQAAHAHVELSTLMRAQRADLDSALARASASQTSLGELEPLRARVAAAEAELSAGTRSHAEMTALLCERVASLEDTLTRSTAALEVASRERAEVAKRTHQLEDDRAQLQAELARRDALLAELETRARAAAPAPVPRRPRTKAAAAAKVVDPQTPAGSTASPASGSAGGQAAARSRTDFPTA